MQRILQATLLTFMLRGILAEMVSGAAAGAYDWIDFTVGTDSKFQDKLSENPSLGARF